MAENNEHVLQNEDRLLPNEPNDNNVNEVHQNDDNESVSSNEADNTQYFTRLETDIREQMSSIAAQVKESISGLSDHRQRRFSDMDRYMQRVDMRLSEQDKQIRDGQLRVTSLANENSNNTHISGLMDTPNINRYVPTNSESLNSNLVNARGDHYIKLKPQSYSGVENDDFEDWLAQFEITAEINGWDYRAKSLYLANSLVGEARSLLNELSDTQHRDYRSLVQKLTSRFGFENRAEVFRAQLKSRVKQKGETIAQLAHAIKKLTRQSYPKASQDLIEALALDHFIDAISETEIRLRLREVGPKSLSEAEAIAVRMEAHRIADRQRTKLVVKVDQESLESTNTPKPLEDQLATISKNLDFLQKRVENMSRHRNSVSYRPQNKARFSQHGTNNFQHSNRNRPDRQSNNNRHDNQSRGDNQSRNPQRGNFGHPNRNSTPQQGNFRQSNQGPGFRLN